MGGCKFIKKRFIIFILPLFTAFTCIGTSDEKVITNITLTENSMVIEIDRRVVNLPFGEGIRISYTNIPPNIAIEAHIEEGVSNQSGYVAIIIVDLTDIPRTIFNEEAELLNERGFFNRILYVNEEAELEIPFNGGSVSAHIFIGEDRIDILDQRFMFRR
jgi:hypothetical protein